jgi:predicted metal-binding membrane protein
MLNKGLAAVRSRLQQADWIDLTLLGVVALAWVYLGWMAWAMQHMQNATFLMPAMTDYEAADLALVWLMWSVMMIAMMMPAAWPMLLAFSAFGERVQPPRPRSHRLVFAAGYALVWAAFSIAATLLQWALLAWRLVSPMMVSTSRLMGGALLCVAGAYQFTQFKSSCLALCRSPVDFLVRNWRSGAGGAVWMGVRHGIFCLGCCWALMSLLFVLGVMNLWWVATLAALVLIEKSVPSVLWVPRLIGTVLVAWGLSMFLGFGPAPS